MIRLHDLAYVRLGTRDLDAASRFATDVLGLQLAARKRHFAAFRSGARAATLIYVAGDPRERVVGIELADPAALDEAAAAVECAGHRVQRGTVAACAERRVSDFIAITDPGGNRIELAVRPHQPAARFFPGRDAGVTRFSGVELGGGDAAQSERFWTRLLSARVSDWIGNAPLLRFERQHHAVALRCGGSGLHRIDHAVADLDDLMRSYYFLRERGMKILFGPGRQPTSDAIFLHFAGPDGMQYGYVTGMRDVGETHRARQFPDAPQSYCLWGARPAVTETAAETIAA